MTAKALSFKGFSLIAAILSMFCFSSCNFAALVGGDDEEDESEERVIKDSKPVITEGNNWICLTYATSGVQVEYKATYSGDKLESYYQIYTYESKELRDQLWLMSYSSVERASKTGDRSIAIDYTDQYVDYTFDQMRSAMEALKINLEYLFE